MLVDIGSSVASWSRRSADTSRAGGRAASVATASERASQASGSFISHSSHHTLGPTDPVHLTPQQLGAMGKSYFITLACNTLFQTSEHILTLYGF